MFKKILIFIFITLFYKIGFSQTEVSGNVASDTKWTKAKSPYVIVEELTIFGGVTLEIESGVVVTSVSNKRIKVYGSLLCSGVPGDSVYFNACMISAEYDTRQSIRLNYCVATNSNCFLNNDYCEKTIIKHSRFHNNNTVIYNSIPYNQMFVDSCLFQKNGICIYYYGTTVTNSIFSENEIGINYANNVDLIKNCEFINNSDVAIRIDNGNVENNLIINNNTGINTLSSKASIKNNTIKNNGIGVQNNASILDFSKNQICNNTEFNFKHTYPGTINIQDNCWCSSNIDSIKATNSIGVMIVPTSNDCKSTGNDLLTAENKSIRVYPTLVNRFLNLDLNNQYIKEVDIVDYLGRNVLSFELKFNKEVLDVSSLTNGIYFIVNKDNRINLKFIKTN